MAQIRGSQISGSVASASNAVNLIGPGTINGSYVFTGTQTFSGSLIPAGPYASNTSSYNLGSPTAAWKDLYISNGTVYFITGSTSSSISFSSGSFVFSGGSGVAMPNGLLAITGSFALKSAENINNVFLITNHLNNNLLAVSQSGVIIIATQSAEITVGTVPIGGIYFTSGGFFVGLE